MTLDGPGDGSDVGDPAHGPDRIGGGQAVAEARDREECYHDLRRYDQAPGRSPDDIRSPDGSQPCDDGRWKWKGLELDPEANRIAEAGLAARRRVEGRDAQGDYGEAGITPAMRRIEAELQQGTLVPDTERFALKSPERFKEKLAKMIERYPDQACGDLASAIHDGIRYTFLFPAEDYTAGVADVTERLTDEGFELLIRKPSWDADDYRGVNSRWRDNESGVLFEVQFHTPESWEAKQRTHDIYEQLCDTRATPRVREKLEEQQQSIVTAIPVPPGAEDITYYVKGQQDRRE
jgi:hypothetical protein